jgi:hypothetical protein
MAASSHANDASSSGNGAMNLGNWLRSLGLERHEAAFRDEEILRDPKEDHLRELGLPLGGKANRAGSLFWLSRYSSGRPRPMLRMPEKKTKGSAPLLGPTTVI